MRERTDRELERMFELDAGPGPAQPADDRRAAAIVAAALAGAGFGPFGGGGGAQPGGGAAPVAAKAAGGKLALLIGGGAALAIAVTAAVWIGAGSSRELPAPRPAPVAAPIAPIAPVVPDPVAPTPAPVVAPVAPDDTAEPEIEMPADPATPRHPGAKPEDLLAKANRERAAHHWKSADALYAEVSHASPNSLPAQTALVASAQLHLEHLADPRGATIRFRAALASKRSHALDEDARWGLAEAARARSDAAAEKRALDDFLAHHASSPLAARARARLADL